MDSMEQIYQAHARTVYKFLLSQCHDADLAEELTQETFYQAVRSIDRFHGNCKVSVWLCQIAKHLWYQHLRKRQPEEPLPEEGGLARPLRRGGHPGPAGPPGPAAADPRPASQHPGGGVPPGLRRALSFREIGDVLGRTETWARVTFYRGKEALRKGGARA